MNGIESKQIPLINLQFLSPLYTRMLSIACLVCCIFLQYQIVAVEHIFSYKCLHRNRFLFGCTEAVTWVALFCKPGTTLKFRSLNLEQQDYRINNLVINNVCTLKYLKHICKIILMKKCFRYVLAKQWKFQDQDNCFSAPLLSRHNAICCSCMASTVVHRRSLTLWTNYLSNSVGDISVQLP